MLNRLLWVSIALAVGSIHAQAQWINHPAPGVPRTKDGKVNLAAPAPRLANGQPDLSGIWQAEAAPRELLLKIFDGHTSQTLGEASPSIHFMNVLSDYKPDEITLAPWAAQLLKQRGSENAKDLPSAKCLPLGLPMMDTALFPRKVIQTPGLVLMLYEELSMFRQIYTDGRKHTPDPEPSFVGYSVGRWDGDTLVVEVTGFKDRGWMDASGHPHSDAMRLTERFRRRDFGHLDVQITVDDSKTFSKPFSFKFTQQLMPDTDLIETFCENEKDRERLKG